MEKVTQFDDIEIQKKNHQYKEHISIKNRY